jgi:6-phosphogluconolactonase (cycloisomerase 2 family)
MNFLCGGIARLTFPALALLAITGCGGGDSQPPPTTYSIGGRVAGIDAGQSVVLQDNGGDDLTVSANGAFTFATKIASGGAYAVTVSPLTGQTCTVAGGSGTVSANVTNVTVTCVGSAPPAATVGGTVSGLVGQGLVLELSGPDLVLEIRGNGDFVFPPVSYGGRLIVNIKQQPHSPTQRCVARHESFVFPPLNVTDVSVVCGEFLYVADTADNTISAFSVDAATGSLVSASPPVTAGMSPDAMASTVYSRDLKYLYVVDSGNNDVSVFGVDYASGVLTAVPGSPFAAGTHPRALSLYSVANAGDYSPPPHRTHTYLYVANAGSDDVSAYAVDRGSGVPTRMSPASYAAGTGPSVLAIHPSHPFLYTANTGGSSDISAFLINTFTGGLTPIVASPFPSGSSVSSLAFGAGGKFLYAADASGGAACIYGFSVDPATGVLTRLAGFPYTMPPCNDLVVDQAGNYLYVTTGSDVLGYSIDQQTGALNPLPGFPVAVGANADSLSIEITNQFLYVRNGSAGTVTGFELNAATGELTPMPGSPFAVGRSADFIATL